MPRTALLCEASEGCPGRAWVTLDSPDHCELRFTHESLEGERVFQCALQRLQDASMGAKAYLASPDGICEIVPMSKRVVIAVAPHTGAAKAYYFVPRACFEMVVDDLMSAGNLAARVSVL